MYRALSSMWGAKYSLSNFNHFGSAVYRLKKQENNH